MLAAKIPSSSLDSETTQSDGSCLFLTIPSEITAQIFTYCLPASISPPEIDTAPLLLTRICRDWRNLAQDSPELWTSLKIDRAAIPVELIETWLSRAQTLPLSLELEVSSWDDVPWNSAEVIVVFERHSQTWRDVALDLPFEQLYLFGESSHLHLPLLERLAVAIHELALELPPLTAFQNAPALRRLSLSRDVLGTKMQLPWAQITSMEFGSGSLRPEDVLTILQFTPNVVKCSVTTHNDLESVLPDVVAPFMFLTSLKLETIVPEVMNIFDHISVPALQVLDLSSILFSGRELVRRLRPILSQPAIRLRDLRIRIDGDKPREADFLQVLEMQSALENFELWEGSLGLLIAICRRLTLSLSDGSPVLLPHLRSFSASPHIYPAAEITTTFPVMLDALVDALSSRWAAPSGSCTRIRDCGLSWSGAMTDDLDNIVEAFRPRRAELIALGINMSLLSLSAFGSKFTL
ncbi:F-box domain-containing protein [Mycena venus]|uniref:F-box domain-containing protein n=1 Tax=Mycena venus TaxID=2733690 RepID=A0A8H6X2J4_9AGAR|nr:F-box domain-containing protein [Mycena venus]